MNIGPQQRVECLTAHQAGKPMWLICGGPSAFDSIENLRSFLADIVTTPDPDPNVFWAIRNTVEYLSEKGAWREHALASPWSNAKEPHFGFVRDLTPELIPPIESFRRFTQAREEEAAMRRASKSRRRPPLDGVH
jgi:hypothetical protein